MNGLDRERRGAVMVLSLHRPRARNALSRELVEALASALDEALADEGIGAVVLASADARVFAAGGDLTELAQLPMDRRGADRVIELGLMLEVIESCPLPVIAAVSGAVLGGGCELVLMCDLVLMDPGATMRFVHVTLGLTPAWGGATRLAERVGAGRARDLLYSARVVAAEEAQRIGLCDRVVGQSPVREHAITLAKELADRPRAALAAMKRAAHADTAARGDAFAHERDIFRQAWGSDPHRRAFAALARRVAAKNRR
jgi:enoyl-CoA hydratase